MRSASDGRNEPLEARYGLGDPRLTLGLDGDHAGPGARGARAQQRACGRRRVVVTWMATEPSMARIDLKLFGGFEAAWSSGGPLPLATKKAKALLAYCA